MIIVRKKGSMQVGVGVNPAWSRSKLHSTSLSRRVCGLRRTAAHRPRQNPPAIVRTRCAVSEPASERQGEHQNHARLICSLLAAVTLVSLARAIVTENSLLHRLYLQTGKDYVLCLAGLHCFIDIVNVTQVMSPACAFARGGSTLRDQSRDMEAEMQQLIQSRLKTGQSSLPELKLNSVNFCAKSTADACQMPAWLYTDRFMRINVGGTCLGFCFPHPISYCDFGPRLCRRRLHITSEFVEGLQTAV